MRVPLGPRAVAGMVVALRRPAAGSRDAALRPVLSRLEEEPSLTEKTLQLGLWVARHYGAPPGEALFALVPAAVRRGRSRREDPLYEIASEDAARALAEEPGTRPGSAARRRVVQALLSPELAGGATRSQILEAAGTSDSPLKTLRKQGLIRVRAADVPGSRPEAAPAGAANRPEPTREQAAALELLLPMLRAGACERVLLHGVTGSGKTEIYLRLMEEALALGRTAILLVPEIALTPQTVGRIKSRIGRVAVLHSMQSDGDRAGEWLRLRRGQARVAVGPRSAIFAPLDHVGVIIVDEEHETTFKQQQSPRYHARDAAMQRAEIEGALLVMGTATPSLECEGLVEAGRMRRIELRERVAGRPLPPIAIVDMRHEKPVGAMGVFSRPLVLALETALHRNEQAMLFLNRRGYATNVLCRRCGWRATCDRCAIQLTHYREAAQLLCHYCGAERPPPVECPDCLAPELRFAGYGTERVAKAAEALFPGRRVVRMDGETLRRRGAAERIFEDLQGGAIDILVGTQVLAKGLDIPNVTLVGVISADTALLIPDFRSSERTFQLLCQVAGRAGRGDAPGRVVIQTFTPDHAAIQCAARHDHRGFAREELRERRSLGYPPYGSLARIVVESGEAAAGLAFARTLGAEASAWPEIQSGEAAILGPAPCPIPLIKGSFRHHLLLTSRSADTMTALLPRLPRRSDQRLRALVDRDPVALL